MRILLTCGVVATYSVAAVCADDFKLEEGYVRLDNGKDLVGWTAKAEGWEVKDSVIHLDAKKAKGNIYSEKTHGQLYHSPPIPRHAERRLGALRPR